MRRGILGGLSALAVGSAQACETCRPSVERAVYGPEAGLGGFGPTLLVLACPLLLMLGVVSMIGRREGPVRR